VLPVTTIISELFFNIFMIDDLPDDDVVPSTDDVGKVKIVGVSYMYNTVCRM
jgi:hypothetical protein